MCDPCGVPCCAPCGPCGPCGQGPCGPCIPCGPCDYSACAPCGPCGVPCGPCGPYVCPPEVSNMCAHQYASHAIHLRIPQLPTLPSEPSYVDAYLCVFIRGHLFCSHHHPARVVAPYRSTFLVCRLGTARPNTSCAAAACAANIRPASGDAHRAKPTATIGTWVCAHRAAPNVAIVEQCPRVP